jgi:hypothetical protein
MKFCDTCGRKYQERKNNINETTCGICKSKLKKKILAEENLKNIAYTRNCKQCNSIIVYSTKQSYENANNKNSICKNCVLLNHNKQMGEEQRLGLRKNGFYGKKHSDEFCKRLSEQYRGRTLKPEQIKRQKENTLRGINHPNHGKSFYDILFEKYGKEGADERLIKFKEKASKNSKGKNNPMYGKPSPQGSGNGWSGWYKDFYFRSLHELQFLLVAERFKLKSKSAESKEYQIKYTDFDGIVRNYFPDYVVNGKWLVEVKPKKLWNTPKNKIKFEAAREWCNDKNLIFKVVDFGKVESFIFDNLIETNSVVLNKRYIEKYFKLKGKIS